MGLLEVAAIVAVVGAAAIAGVVALVVRGRTRRNRVVPEVPTSAPSSWAGAHIPEARLHRRLRGAVEVARAIPDPDGTLIAGRVELERAALAVDDHLVALNALHERERAGRMRDAEAAVASVERAAAQLVDAVGTGTAGGLSAVEAALERARLVAEARAELDEDPTTVIDATGQPDDGRDPDGRRRPQTG